MGNRYWDLKGRMIFVKGAIDGSGYRTFYRTLCDPGARQLNRKALPIRSTEAEAQADLDAYAAQQGWELNL